MTPTLAFSFVFRNKSGAKLGTLAFVRWSIDSNNSSSGRWWWKTRKAKTKRYKKWRNARGFEPLTF